MRLAGLTCWSRQIEPRVRQSVFSWFEMLCEKVRDLSVAGDIVFDLDDVVAFVFEHQKLDVHTIGLEAFSHFLRFPSQHSGPFRPWRMSMGHLTFSMYVLGERSMRKSLSRARHMVRTCRTLPSKDQDSSRPTSTSCNHRKICLSPPSALSRCGNPSPAS